MAAIKKKLLIVSDAPSAPTGLGRITRDLATRIHTHLGDLFEVATLGYGGSGDKTLGFFQYTVEGMGLDWIIPSFPEVVDNFFGKEKGIVLFIWDINRVQWFAQPDHSSLLNDNPGLCRWLVNARDNNRYEKWLYTPIDADGPNCKLTFPLQQTLLGFDKILAYGQWAGNVIRDTIGSEESALRDLAYLPHGIDSSVFFETHRSLCRQQFFKITGAHPILKQGTAIFDDEVLIGIVATNQSRKDWALGIEVASMLSKKHKVRLWIHTDKYTRNWDIPALLVDFGMLDKTIISLSHIQDEKMAEGYSACDLTLGIGAGEGFGYSIFESLFCGTPCVHGRYGGAPEYMSASGLLVEPIAFRYDGAYSCRRPVFNPLEWYMKANFFIGKRVNHPGELDWENLWPRWQEWLKRGL